MKILCIDKVDTAKLTIFTFTGHIILGDILTNDDSDSIRRSHNIGYVHLSA